MRPFQQIWWLNPAWIGGILGAGISVATILVPESMYRNYWRTPFFFGYWDLLVCLASTALFVTGAVAGNLGLRRTRAQHDASAWTDRIPWALAERVFQFSFWGTLLGYLVWGGAAAARGASLNLAIGVLTGDKGASELMKSEYMGTISGVTTLTQFGIAAVVLGMMIGAARGWRKVAVPIAILFALSVARALFNSERLAIIELAIPMLVIGIRLLVLESPFWVGRWRLVLQTVPVFGSVVLVGIFGIFEYFRSWSTYYAGGNLSFWEFNILRLLGYYVTALNNGALLVARIEPTGAPFFTFHFLWRFPLVSSLVNAIYPQLALNSLDTDLYMDILSREANPEFNNGGGLLLPIMDYGLAGALLYWLLIGFACGMLYRWFREMRPAGLMLYPVFFIGVVEMTRILYWGEGRIFPVYLILIPFAWACAAWRRRATKAEQRTLCSQSR